MKDEYEPDIAALLREADPATRKANRRKAREDAARPTPAGFFQRAESDLEAEESAALPSTRMPAAEELPVGKGAGPEKARRRWPATWKLVGGFALVVVASLGMVAGMMAEQLKERAATAASARASVTGAPSVTATVQAQPAMTVGAAPSTTATATATAPPIATAVPAPTMPPHKPTGKPPELKQDRAAPVSPPNVATTATPPTAPTATTPDPAPTSSRWF